MKSMLKVTGDGSHTLFVPNLNEHYHSVNGAIVESLHVFINNGLLMLDSQNARILEIGFGTGLNAYLSALEARKRDLKLSYTTIEKYPLNLKIVDSLNYPEITGNDRSLFETLHRLPWESEEVLNSCFSLKKIKADLQEFNLSGEYDLIYFDAFGPDVQPELWSGEIIRSVAAVTRKGGLFVTYSAKGILKRNLKSAGFEVFHPEGPPGKRQITRAVKL